MKSNPKIISKDNHLVIIDNDEVINNSKAKRIIERYKSYFSDFNTYTFDTDVSYVVIEDFINKINEKMISLNIKLLVDGDVQEWINKFKYAIKEQQITGITIKQNDERWLNEYQNFLNILDSELYRPLKNKQLQACFFLIMMKKAANFSVPGAGKTAMTYGSFAYLSSKKVNKINRVLVVCPISAFEAWRYEFLEIFKNKRKLHFMNLRDDKYKDEGKIRGDWGFSNVIVINYESLGSKLKVINELIDSKTMLVFDEVHRVKGIDGLRAKKTLELSPSAIYRYVLTGTPIPNSYKDIFNFLNILYKNEYKSFFNWELGELNEENARLINEKINPFFYRINKRDLKIPPADSDLLYICEPTEEQRHLITNIYEIEEGKVLALFIRLIQASTNPALLLDKINYDELGLVDNELNIDFYNNLDERENELKKKEMYQRLNLKEINSNKFDMGIKLVKSLVSEGKKVVVWGIFVKTMIKIKKSLEKEGITANLVYGATPKDIRVDLINEVKDGEVDVLISNPNTLGESISLHKSIHDAVYFEYNFNLTFMLQSRDRIHRLGLHDDQYTRYHYLLNEGNLSDRGFIDERIYKRLKEKESIMLTAIDSDFLYPEIQDDYFEEVKRIIKE